MANACVACVWAGIAARAFGGPVNNQLRCRQRASAATARALRFAVRALGVFQHATMNGHSLAGPEHLAVCELAVERARSWVSAVVEACRGHFKALADASTRLASAVSTADVGVWVCGCECVL